MVDRLISYQLGLLGHPVGHSQSPQIHAAFARQFGLHINYQLMDVEADQLTSVLQEFMTTAHGCNITLPHKQRVVSLLDQVSERAQQVNAVNTIYWRDGQLCGDNTDGPGLILDLTQVKKWQLKNKRILIIGAGGAVAGIIPSLLTANPAQITISNRSHEKAQQLAQDFNIDCASFADLNQLPSQDLIIHGTSMGHHGHSPTVPENIIHADTFAYDLSYGDAAKPFLSNMQSLGCAFTSDGLGMLYGQAVLAFNIWFKKMPDLKLLIGT